MGAAEQKQASAVTLLRHRFGTIAELQQHLHSVDGRSFFFFREQGLDLPGGARVLLEVSFNAVDQQALLRGQVLGRVEGALPGLWLEFPDTRLRHRADQGAMGQRKQRRVGCEILVEVRRLGNPHLGRLIDLSLGGARLTGISGLKVHEDVDLRILASNSDWPSALGRARVVRTENTDVGARFLRDHPQSRMAITRLFGLLQESWSRALEVEHPSICCRGGQLIEPALPHIKGRAQPL